MSPPEICWRLKQRNLQKKEWKRFGHNPQSLISSLFYPETQTLKFRPNSLGICFSNKAFSTYNSIRLLGGYDYATYRKHWHAGFQTSNDWDPGKWSYSLNYKQADNIGDARTNWELNRHHQFALLAKNFYATRKNAYLQEIKDLFYDWNNSNPFLFGISWTSVMEVAIRAIQWTFALAFLSQTNDENTKTLLKDLETGILNMVGYLTKHYSRYSSANNHLLIEACSILIAGFAFGCDKWKNLAIKILDKQLYLQNFSDGINKEMSLHYQTFGMEAYAIAIHLIKSEGNKVPKSWIQMMENQCKFLAHSILNNSITCEFGDNDEGKILDLEGLNPSNHSIYVLQLCSIILEKRFCSFQNISENIKWLFSDSQITKVSEMTQYDSTKSISFPIGGYSFLKTQNSEIVVAIDHAPLGFGSIAAHGHADALSFQLFANGKPLIIDPGTFIYHCWLQERNNFRKSINHNTVVINGKEQSQMLGPFLWGKRAITKLEKSELSQLTDIIIATTTGLSGIKHTRTFSLDKTNQSLTIDDQFDSECNWTQSFITNFGISPSISQRKVTIQDIELSSDKGNIEINDTWASPKYGIKEKVKVINIYGKGKYNRIVITKKK